MAPRGFNGCGVHTAQAQVDAFEILGGIVLVLGRFGGSSKKG